MSFFFSARTPLTDAIDGAIAEKANLENFALFLEVTDVINETETGAKDAIKHLKKKIGAKLQSLPLLKLLTLLEVCLKNCHHRFHVEFATKDFLDQLAKQVLAAKGMAREKGLEIIQSSADAFKMDPNLSTVIDLYQSLLDSGVEFPAQDLDHLPPMITPDVSVDPSAASQLPSAESPLKSQVETDEDLARALEEKFRIEDEERQRAREAEVQPLAQQQQQRQQQQQQQQEDEFVYEIQRLPEGQRVEATPEQVAKLKDDLEYVEGTAIQLDRLVSSLDSYSRVMDNQHIQDLAAACKSMRERIGALLNQILNEDMMGELLRFVDMLNASLEKHEHRTVEDQQKAPPLNPPARNVAPPTVHDNYHPVADIASLSYPAAPQITLDDLDEEESMQADSFDMFAQTRNTTFAEMHSSSADYHSGTGIHDTKDSSLGAAIHQSQTTHATEPESLLITLSDDDDVLPAYSPIEYESPMLEPDTVTYNPIAPMQFPSTEENNPMVASTQQNVIDYGNVSDDNDDQEEPAENAPLIDLGEASSRPVPVSKISDKKITKRMEDDDDDMFGL